MTTPRLLSERYELGEVLGFGGMSEVHRGLDTRLGRDVAVKVLRADLARDPQFQMRFRREAQNAAALNHPAIVAVYDTGEVQGEFGPLPYIVMEYVDGQTLREIVKTTGPMSQQQVLDVMADVCAALDFSHRHQIIHRDVKPANIMINRAGAVKVMDFGIARALGEGQNVTQTAAVIGTAQYLSPEQARGEAVDARSDVYAAGCVLYELLTGEPPFTGDSPVAVAYQHVREDPKSPSEVNPAVPPQLDAVVLKALSKNPANRYQSAAEMRSDLVRVRSGQAPFAPAVMSADERTAMMAAGPPTGATRRLNGRGVPPPPPPPAYDDYYADEEPPRRTGRVVAIVVGVLVVLGLVGFVAYQLLSGPATPSQVAVPGVVGQTQQDASNQLIAAGLRVGNVAQQESSVDQVGKVLGTEPRARHAGGGALDRRPHGRLGPRVRQRARALGHERRRRHRAAEEPGPHPRQADQPADRRFHPGREGRQLQPRAGGAGEGRQPGRHRGGRAADHRRRARRHRPGQGRGQEDAAGGGLRRRHQHRRRRRPEGSVLSTDPPAGTQVQPGSKVTMQVSKGNQAGAVPDVRGQTVTAGQADPQQAGFTNVSTQTVDIPGGNGQLSGRVVQQDPSPGSTADPDQQITLFVARGNSTNNGLGRHTECGN